MELPRPAVVVALLTPFGPDGEVDRGALRAHVERLVEAGVDGLMPGGSTGEGALLDEEELVGVVEDVVSEVRGQVPVLAHVGRPSTRATVRLASRALAAGAVAVSAVTPYYHAPSPDGLRRHYAALLAAVDGAPVLAYTIPSHAHVDVAPETWAALAADGVAGLKDSSGDPDLHAAYVAADPDVFIGAARHARASLALGSAGAILAIANLRPELAVALRDAHVAGDEAAAAEAQEGLREAERGLGDRATVVLALKRALAEQLEGYPVQARALVGSAHQMAS
jgi:4-hydroxy-tetrahydrodipicolinate synthase